jgi:glycosyltransferase involved in cell wall biosynthesis
MFKVSVITTLYNYRKYIVDAIESFFNQDFVESEMIIIDDGSTDDAYEVIEKYKGDRLKYVRLNINMGYSYAKNIGIKHANSDILVMLDADDMLVRDGVSTRYNKLIEGYDFVHGPCLDYKDGKMGGRNRMWELWLKEHTYTYVHAQGVMLKKNIHREIGLYDESLRSKSDREFFARVFNHGYKIGVVDVDVAIYRKHGQQMHRSKEKMVINKQLQKEVLKKIEKRKTDLSDLIFLS